MLGHLSWKRLLSEAFVIFIIAGILGTLFGYLPPTLLGAAILLLLWHFHQMIRLSHWLWRDHHFYPPEGRGSWRPLFHGLHRMRREQRRERKRLADILSYFRKGAEAMPDAVILCDRKGRLNWCNPQAELLLDLHWPKDEGQLLFNLIRHPSFLTYFEEKDFSNPYHLSLDHHTILECRLYYPYIEDNLLIIVRDVSEREAAERTRQTFFASVNHELRIPLTVMRGYLEMLLEESELTDFERTALLRMEEQGERLQQLVEQLMLLTRLETDKQEGTKEQIDLALLIQKLVDDYQAVEESPTPITLTLPPSIPIYGDANQLLKVITNLFYNAIEHNPPNTPITISATESEAGYTISFKDRGQGIPKEHLDKLTERFYRVDSSRNRAESGGSGLGLAIVKHALNNHQSRLIIESTPNKGSTFSFTLPKIG